MEINAIRNAIDNAENSGEMRDALESLADDIAEQFVAAWNASRANPYVERISMVAFFGMVEERALALRQQQSR